MTGTTAIITDSKGRLCFQRHVCHSVHGRGVGVGADAPWKETPVGGKWDQTSDISK